MTKPKVCKDCTREGRQGKVLNAPHPGPRCYWHHKAWTKAQAEKAASKRRALIYGLTPVAYKAILEAQGGGCAICGRKPYKGGRMLAVDHDHACCPGRSSCGDCIRGLACWTCNKFLEHIKDDPAKLLRGADYLRNPPAQLVLQATAHVP